MGKKIEEEKVGVVVDNTVGISIGEKVGFVDGEFVGHSLRILVGPVEGVELGVPWRRP